MTTLSEYVLFDTDNYKDLDDEFLFNEDLYELKHYISLISKARNGRKRNQFVMISKRSSHYGAIANNGATGIKLAESIDDMFYGSWDSFKFNYNPRENKYSFTYFDHDGTTTAEFAPISYSQYSELKEINDFEKLRNSIREIVDNFQPKLLLDCWVSKDDNVQKYAFP